MQTRLGVVLSLVLLGHAARTETRANPFLSGSPVRPVGAFTPFAAFTPPDASASPEASTSVAEMFGQAATTRGSGSNLNPKWGLTFNLGFGGTGGDFGSLLTSPIAG